MFTYYILIHYYSYYKFFDLILEYYISFNTTLRVYNLENCLENVLYTDKHANFEEKNKGKIKKKKFTKRQETSLK